MYAVVICTNGHQIIVGPVNYPVVLGHEFSGTIAALGKRVKGWNQGDRVVSETAAVIDPQFTPYQTGSVQS